MYGKKQSLCTHKLYTLAGWFGTGLVSRYIPYKPMSRDCDIIVVHVCMNTNEHTQ